MFYRHLLIRICKNCQRTEKFNHIKANFEANNIQAVVSINPYWNKDAVTYCDPDGFRVIVSFRKK